jgi:hypothetical protein
VAGGALLLLVAIVVVALGRNRRSSRRPAATAVLSGVPGRIVVLTGNGGLALSAPGGGRLTPLPALGQHQNNNPAAVSLDGRFIALGDGTVVSIGASGPAIEPSAVKIADQVLPYPDPLADHDQDLLLGSTGPNGTTDFSLDALATGQVRSLGVADAAEGDPDAEGAFVAIPVGGPPSTSGIGLPADTEVELEDVGRAPVVLATADAIDQDVDLAPGVSVNLTPLPDPAGDKVAIVVFPVDGGPASLVVLDRTGHLVGTVPSSLGPSAGPPDWSHNGDQLAYATGELFSDGSTELVVWTPGATPKTHILPTPGGPGRCLWSPDASAILCGTANPHTGAPTGWVVAPPGNAALVAVSASAQPLAWIMSPQGSGP